MNDLDILVGPLSDLEDSIILIAPWRTNRRVRKLLRKALVRADFRALLKTYYLYDDDVDVIKFEAEQAGFEVSMTRNNHPRFKPLEKPCTPKN